MYELDFLPLARQDMLGLVRYISKDLSNPGAAERLADELIAATQRLQEFPYSGESYHPIRPLAREYRRLPVQSYLLFYWVDNARQRVVVARVLYGGRDIGALL